MYSPNCHNAVCIVVVVDVFEPFLKAYIDEFKFKSISTDDWKQFLYKFFDDKVISAISIFFCVHSSTLQY